MNLYSQFEIKRDANYRHIQDPKEIEQIFLQWMQPTTRQFLLDIAPLLSQVMFLEETSLENPMMTTGIANCALLDTRGNIFKMRLCGNIFTPLPESIGGLSKLTFLELILNKMTALPLNFQHLNYLKILSLVGNHFNEYPPILHLLPRLYSVDLCDNPLKVLPWNLCNPKMEVDVIRGMDWDIEWTKIPFKGRSAEIWHDAVNHEKRVIDTTIARRIQKAVKISLQTYAEEFNTQLTAKIMNNLPLDQLDVTHPNFKPFARRLLPLLQESPTETAAQIRNMLESAE